MTPLTPVPRAAERSMLLVVASMAAGLVIIGLVLAVIGAELVPPEPWMLLVVAAATAVAWAAALVSPVPKRPGDGPVPATSLLPVVMMRVVLLEAPALLGLVLAFVASPMNLTIYVMPALFAVAGMWLLARPTVVRARMERDRHVGQPRASR